MSAAEAVALERAQQGDVEAFRMLVEEHSHKMFRLAFRMTGNEQDAEDVVQETFLRAHRRMKDFESRAHFSSWVHRSASNYAIDLLRRRKRWGTQDTAALEETAVLASPDPTPDRSAFSAEVRQRIEVQLKQLTPNERVAFTLRHYEGLGISEIGEIMGTRDSATKNHIFRAVRKLRSALRPLLDS